MWGIRTAQKLASGISGAEVFRVLVPCRKTEIQGIDTLRDRDASLVAKTCGVDALEENPPRGYFVCAVVIEVVMVDEVPFPLGVTMAKPLSLFGHDNPTADNSLIQWDNNVFGATKNTLNQSGTKQSS
ncbi:Uncharacterized protein Fot_05677 [Forsythia ovata]|uniref:Uncharacterized protein n=1 Tax=Forsythia ovata TaxID=205694 RepID=A0ABD1WQV5_9LAMI